MDRKNLLVATLIAGISVGAQASGKKQVSAAFKPVARVNVQMETPVNLTSQNLPIVSMPELPKIFDGHKSSSVADILIPKFTLSSVESPRRIADKVPGLSPLEAVATIPDPVTHETTVETKALKELSPAEARLLEAQIVLEKHHNPETALGLVVSLVEEKGIRYPALYTYGQAAREIGLQSEFRATMMKIAEETKDEKLGARATQQLVDNVADLEISDMKTLTSLVDKYDITVKGNDAYQFYTAKYFLEQGNLGKVEEALEQIPEKSKYRLDALLIQALDAYRTGKLAQAQAQLETLMKEASKEDSLRSIGAITLARVHFQKNEYKEASAAYLEVDKNSPLWLSAMVEQAWTQILLGDSEGAAGNMFSLHTDYFKNSFSPESYMARSVAYLNLCQFGDGMQTLENFKHKYGPLVSRLAKYQQEKKAAQDDYDTVRTWLKNSDLKEVSGLPRSFIVEMAHHPSFMKTQNEINHFEDEIDRFNKANMSLLTKEKETLTDESQARADLAKLKSHKADKNDKSADLKTTIADMEARVAMLKARYDFVKRARTALKDVRTRVIARIDKEKVVLKQQASKALRGRLAVLTGQLAQTLEQNEVMQYEIMAGAGEHLRAQAAGAEIKGTHTEVKMDDKNVKWTYKGEIWEDEIGHYRSSLKNVCSKDEKVAAQ